MKPFKYSRLSSRDEVLNELSDRDRPLAGGTDLLTLLKLDLETPESLIDIKQARLPREIKRSEGELRIGALCTINELAEHRETGEEFPLLVQAAELTATKQIRNRATLGGNLLQRPRCWYFRNPHTDCWLKGGDDCPAVHGRNEHHALYGDSPCRAVHPSDLAGCLLALDASVTLQSSRAERRLTLSDFFALPEVKRRRENRIDADELLTWVSIPSPATGWQGIYLKAMDRKAWAFALVGIAVLIKNSGGEIDDIRIVANGVAPIPWRLQDCEDSLRGTRASQSDMEAAIRTLSEGARPLGGNDYKLDLCARLLRDALARLLHKD